MRMDEGLDTGPVLAQRRIPIDPQDDAGSLHDKLAALGAEMMQDVLSRMESSGVEERPQPASGATYARKIEKDDLVLDWSRSAEALERTIRALRPSPGAGTTFKGEPFKVWRATVASGRGEPGTVLEAQGDSMVVACGQGALRLTEIQRAGGRRMSAEEFLHGHPLEAGHRFA